MEQFISLIQQYLGDFWVTAIAFLPLLELRVAIPLACIAGVDPIKAFLLSVLGNMLPVVPIILCGRWFINLLKRTKPFRSLAEKIEARTMKNKDKVIRYSLLGLFVLVAIPVPGTGAWTGALLAALMDIRLKKSLPVIFAGVCTAGVIFTILCYSFALLV